jgi:hypothetical protein
VLFSQDKVAGFINQQFEPVWESVRPVPVVRIDFGNGNVLTRTLHGNILTSVCSADGAVLDALPGIYAADTYLDRLDQLRLLARYMRNLPAEERAAKVREYHARQAEAIKKEETPEQFVVNRKIAAMTKRDIERPVEIVLQRPDAVPEAKKEAKLPVEDPADVASWKTLAEDTRLNETTRRLQIHELLRDAGLVKPEKVVKPIYKDVLHADLDDPYLGLGKVLFENYPFAKEDAKR